MKKVIYGGLFLALIGIGFVACKKAQFAPENKQVVFDSEFHVASDNRMLIFKSTDDYEKVVNNTNQESQRQFISTIQKLNFESYAEKQENVKLGSSNCDSFFAEIINSDGVVQIGDNVYKVDLSNGIVGVINSTNISEYTDLVSLNATNKNIRRFTTQDDVIELAESGAESKTRSCGGIDGTEQVTSVVDFGTVNGVLRRCQASVTHFVGGVYFRTTARFVPATAGIIYTDLKIQGPQAWAKKRPCGSGDIMTSASGVKKSGTTQQIWELYQGSRNLNGYYLFARIKCTLNGIVLYSTWAGRNINSPY